MKDRVTVPVVVEVTLPEVKRLNLKPDDIIVYEADASIRVTDMQAARIKEQLQDWFPGHRVVVITNGHLRVLDEGDQPALPV